MGSKEDQNCELSCCTILQFEVDIQLTLFQYPMVWMTPTGQKALQVHGIAVRKMFLKTTPMSEVQEIDDMAKIRELHHGWQEKIIRPGYVFMAPTEEGDVSLWDNWVCSF